MESTITFCPLGFRKQLLEVCLRDTRKIEVPLVVETIDTAAGILMPFYEEDSDLLFLAGKVRHPSNFFSQGDGAISYYELQLNGDPQNFFHTLSSYKTNEPTRGCAALSRRHYDVFNNEIMRLYRLSNPDKLTPISFIVPRKSDNFQEDLYPPCRSSEPDQKSLGLTVKISYQR